MSAQAQRAYEDYWSAFYGADAVRRSIPWDDCGERGKEAWRAAVAAAVDGPRLPKKPRTEQQEQLLARHVRLMDEMNDIQKAIKEMLPRTSRFFILVVDHGPGGYMIPRLTMPREAAIRCVRRWLEDEGAL